MVGNNLYCTALYIFIIYKYIIYKRKAFRNILNTWETYGNCKHTVTDEMLFGSKRDSVEAACISEAIGTKRREQDEDGTSLLTFPTILKTPDLHLKKPQIFILKPQISIFRKPIDSTSPPELKKQLNWAGLYAYCQQKKIKVISYGVQAPISRSPTNGSGWRGPKHMGG